VEELKTCSKCRVPKVLSEFDKKRKGRNSRCKSCRAGYMRQHCASNPEQYAAKRQRAKQAKLKYIDDYLYEHPCIDCKETDIVVLDFDHRDGDEKEFNIGEAIKVSWTRLLAEINKCDVRCANCHRRRHARMYGRCRGQGIR